MSFRNRFRRNNLSIRPVNRIKHVVDGQFGVVLGTQLVITLADSKDNPIQGNSPDVETGSKINGIYLKVEAYATTAGALSNIYMALWKNVGNNLVLPNANVIGINENKRYSIHQEMVMLEQSVNGNPRTLFNGVIVIPRGYRRNGPNDIWTLAIYAPGVNANVCIQAHYKEFR